MNIIRMNLFARIEQSPEHAGDFCTFVASAHFDGFVARGRTSLLSYLIKYQHSTLYPVNCGWVLKNIINHWYHLQDVLRVSEEDSSSWWSVATDEPRTDARLMSSFPRISLFAFVATFREFWFSCPQKVIERRKIWDNWERVCFSEWSSYKNFHNYDLRHYFANWSILHSLVLWQV